MFKKTYFEEHLHTAASELTLESDCLEICFWTVACSNSVILQKYLSLSNQSFKHNSALMLSLHLTPLHFEPRFRMFIINSYYTKSKR